MGNLKPLFDAIDGLPDERKATSAIALFAVIPAAIVGILGGALLTPQRARDWELSAPAIGGAVMASAVVIAAVYLTRWLFGFHGVARAATAAVGLIIGLAFGAWLANTFTLGWWPLLLGPAFAVFNVWLRPFSRRRAETTGVATEAEGVNPMLTTEESGEWWAVYRTDDTGNSFLVREHLTKEEAERVAAEFTARGHKQHYWVEREKSD